MSTSELSSVIHVKADAVMPLTNDEIRILYDSLVLNRYDYCSALQKCQDGSESETIFRDELKIVESLIDRVAKHGKDRCGWPLQTVSQMDSDDGN